MGRGPWGLPKLPGFDHFHALVSANLLGEVNKIEDPQENNQAYQYFRVALNKAIPRVKASKTSVKNEIFQLNLTVSTQKDAVNNHKAKLNKQVEL